MEDYKTDKEKIPFNQMKGIFNSKLFINFDSFEEEDNMTNDTKENSIESEKKNYLSYELIEELELDNNKNKKKENFSSIVNTLLSMVDNGYEFKPKNYKPNAISNKNFINNIRIYKNDWTCFFCNNLNFSFRTKCNRCKRNKSETEKIKYINKF